MKAAGIEIDRTATASPRKRSRRSHRSRIVSPARSMRPMMRAATAGCSRATWRRGLQGQGRHLQIRHHGHGLRDRSGDRIVTVITDKGRETADHYRAVPRACTRRIWRASSAQACRSIRSRAIRSPHPSPGATIRRQSAVSMRKISSPMRPMATAFAPRRRRNSQVTAAIMRRTDFRAYARRHARALSRRRGLECMRVLGGLAADDARRHADPWPHAAFANFWFNTGQGHMGWTMSHGASRITADLIAGKKPAIATRWQLLPLRNREPHSRLIRSLPDTRIPEQG